MLLLTIVLVATLPSPTASSQCNITTEWTCSNDTTQCIPLQHKCDNVPDCDDKSDETNCPLPPALSNFSAVIGDYEWTKGNLEQATFTWTTDSSKLTNVTVNVTYIDGATQQLESFLIYAIPLPCVDRTPCNNTKLCSTGVGYRYQCRKQCGLCRRDQVWARNWARFDMLSLLRKNATNIQGRAWASNYRGDGPTTQAITLSKPELSGVGGLKANVMLKLTNKISTKLTWVNDSIIIPKPYLDFGKQYWIYYNITKCRVVKGKKVDCEMVSEMAGVLNRYKIYWNEKFNTEYSFSVKSYHSKYPDVVVGPSVDVYLNATMNNFGTKHGVNVVLMIVAVVGTFVISHLRLE